MFAFDPCIGCRHPLHCRTVQQCCISVEPAIAPELPVRAGPPYPTKRGGVMIADGVMPATGPKILDADYVGIEQRILAKMTAINGAAEYVVERFCELSKTDSGTPLFKPKFTDGSFTPTGRLLCNLVVEAIQGEVTL